MNSFYSTIHNIQTRVKQLQVSGTSKQDIITTMSSQKEFEGFLLPLPELIPIIFYLPADTSSETLMKYFFFMQDSRVADTGVANKRFAEVDNKFVEAANKLGILDKKSDQIPIITTVVQEHGNTIDAMIDEDKTLRAKIRDLSDRLDFHERLNKFICSVFHPNTLDGQAKELYGLICPTDGHDEL
jgi:hypothetical protein